MPGKNILNLWYLVLKLVSEYHIKTVKIFNQVLKSFIMLFDFKDSGKYFDNVPLIPHK